MSLENPTDVLGPNDRIVTPTGGPTARLTLFLKELLDLITRNAEKTVSSDGATGGTGSAGVGSQYVELTINGTTYKVLHDGSP